ncbi:recombinase family protein [Streptomyces sp. P1-3]|uniref:recombinase family protein n=1 Tax=Streptomyces sp. P1-3 TaxID=3421658 RepID=UPI003D36A0BC
MSTLPTWDDFQIPPQARRGRVTLNLYDQLSAYLPRRPGAYLRISSDRFGLEAGVDRQLEDAEDTRARLQWGPFAKVYRENDTSAFKKKKVVKSDGSIDWMVIRPQFRQLLADLDSGVIDGVIFYDLDRLVRQPRDLEDLIDIVEYVQRPVVGATGGRMNLINDSDRHMARMMCVMALKSSEDTSRRVARMHLATAQEGKIQGRIAYGWIRKGTDKGKLLPHEADLVAHIFDECLSGETAYSIATKLNKDGVCPPAARQWSSTMINKMLRNPRYAGMVSYSGKHRVDASKEWDGWSLVLFDDDGHPLLGCWDPIVTPKAWSQVQFELQLRRQKRGIPEGKSRNPIVVKYLLSGILKCGRGLVGAQFGRKNGKKVPGYRCPPSAHGGCAGTYIAAKATEQAISEGMNAFLTQLLACPAEDPPGDPDKLRTMRADLDRESARKQDLMHRWTDGTLQEVGLTEDDYFHMLAGTNRKISGLRDAITATEGGSAPRVSKEDLLRGWHEGSLRQRRSVLKRYLHGIEVTPPVEANEFNRSALVKARLRPKWKTQEELAA